MRMFHVVFPDGKKIKECDLIERRLVIEDPKTNSVKQFRFAYASEGAHIMGVAAAPDGSISGGTTTSPGTGGEKKAKEAELYPRFPSMPAAITSTGASILPAVHTSTVSRSRSKRRELQGLHTPYTFRDS